MLSSFLMAINIYTFFFLNSGLPSLPLDTLILTPLANEYLFKLMKLSRKRGSRWMFCALTPRAAARSCLSYVV